MLMDCSQNAANVSMISIKCAKIFIIKRSLMTSPKAIMIHCDGQKARSKWGTKNIESWARENFPDETILRIDSESVADPTHPAYGCVEKINEMSERNFLKTALFILFFLRFFYFCKFFLATIVNKRICSL